MYSGLNTAGELRLPDGFLDLDPHLLAESADRQRSAHDLDIGRGILIMCYPVADTVLNGIEREWEHPYAKQRILMGAGLTLLLLKDCIHDPNMDTSGFRHWAMSGMQEDGTRRRLTSKVLGDLIRTRGKATTAAQGSSEREPHPDDFIAKVNAILGAAGLAEALDRALNRFTDNQEISRPPDSAHSLDIRYGAALAILGLGIANG